MKICLPLALHVGVRIHRRMSRFRLFGKADVLMMRAIGVIGQIRSNAEQIVAPVSFTLMRHAGTQKTVIRFLQEILSQLGISRSAPQIDPDRTCRSLIESMESLL